MEDVVMNRPRSLAFSGREGAPFDFVHHIHHAVCMDEQTPIVKPTNVTLHLKILGWTHIVLGVAAFLLGMFAVFALYGGTDLLPQESKDALIQSGYASGLLWLFLGVSVITVVVGFGLIRAARWARYVLWVFAIIGLFDFPFGTLMGVYAIWVLTRKDSVFSY